MARFRTIGAFCGAVAACALITASSATAADITINPSETHQTIDGFGAFASMPKLLREAGVFWDDRPDSYEIRRFIEELGASAIRFELPPSVYPVEGEPYDWTGSVFGTGGMTNTFRLMREFRELGTERFIFTIWSPPCWMKVSGDCFGPREGNAGEGPLDNILQEQYYDDLALFIADFCQTVLDSVGVEPYAVSVQNEPYFHEPYNSCVYYEDKLNNLVTLTAQALTDAGLGTRIFGAEHMFNNGTGYYGLMLDNAGLDAWTVHGYTNGVDPDYGTAGDWTNMFNTVSGKGKKLWMTETTGNLGTLTAAQKLHSALKSGNVSLWTWWAYADNLGSYGKTDGVNTSFIPGGTYWGSRHYFRFVRPGATMIGCSSTEGTLWSTAFKNADDTYAVVLVNTSSNATTANLVGSGLPSSWQRYESTSTKNCEHTGTVGSSGISVPGSSVLTLFSGDPAPVLPADTITNSVAAPTPTTQIADLTVYGDDTVDVYVNGNRIHLGEDKTGLVSLRQGENIIACKLVNKAWGGGLLASCLLPQSDTMRTDNTWKMQYRDPGTGWTGLGFNDADWFLADQVGPVDMWPGFERWGSTAVNLYYQDAQWITGGFKVYMRKNVNFSSTTNIFVKGNNFTVTCYVDGTELGSSTKFAGTDNLETSHDLLGQISAGTHCVAFEVEDANQDGNGVLFKSYTMSSGSAPKINLVDTTWKAWVEAPTGWNTAGFDDSQWANVAEIDAWSPDRTLPFMYVNTFWYRNTFTSAEATDVRLRVIRANTLPVVKKVEYYNLRGQKITAPVRGHEIAKSVIVKRTIMNNGIQRAAKVLHQD